MAVLYSFLLLLLRKRTKKNKRIKDFQNEYLLLHLFFQLRHLLIFFRFALQEKKSNAIYCEAKKKKHCLISWLRSMVLYNIPQTYPMILVSVFTGLLPFVLLLQHPMCPMSVLLLLYIPLLQCRCSTVVCYLSTAHVFCACLFKKCTVEGTIRPRLRAPNLKVIHGIAQSCPFKLRFLAGCYGNQMHCGRYDL